MCCFPKNMELSTKSRQENVKLCTKPSLFSDVVLGGEQPARVRVVGPMASVSDEDAPSTMLRAISDRMTLLWSSTMRCWMSYRKRYCLSFPSRN